MDKEMEKEIQDKVKEILEKELDTKVAEALKKRGITLARPS